MTLEDLVQKLYQKPYPAISSARLDQLLTGSCLLTGLKPGFLFAPDNAAGVRGG